MVPVEKIKALREKTGVSLAECRAALQSSDGDLARALEALKGRGAALAEKKSGRRLGAGAVSAYIHSNGALGALLLLGCESDFVARHPEFRRLADDLAMQVAAFGPPDNGSLLEQPFVRDEGQTVDAVIKQAIQQFGERIEVLEFSRLALAV